MINILKRDGSLEPLDYEKINKVLLWATDGISGVNASEVAVNTNIQIYDGIKSKEIHQVLIKSAKELISEESPNYQYVAAKLVNYLFRKEVFNTYSNFPRLKDLIKQNVDRDIYDPTILNSYTENEIDKIEMFLKHERDEDFTYAGIQQLIDKYLIRNKKTNEYYETPQFMYIVIAMVVYSNYEDKKLRIKKVKECYDLLSNHEISLPTPILAGLRTTNKQYSSCVLISVDDDLDSIGASSHSVLRYISNKAGIGLNMKLRGIGSPVNNGEKIHTGIVPFVKHFETAVKSCSQGGIRGGAATVYYPFWHYEINEIISLKNNKGNDLNRARRLDHSIQLCRLAYQRFIKNDFITLFQPNEVTDLYDAFGKDNDKFEELYVKYEMDDSKTKKVIPARELFTHLAIERLETGRIYIQNLDNANLHSSFLDKIEMSNLCCEINLPTQPFYDINSEDGEIALCVLAAINLGKIKKFSDLEKISEHTVYILNKVIDDQEYIVESAKKMLKRRSIGVGVTNFAYWLAKNNLGYNKESLGAIDELFENIQYNLLKASMEQAKLYGKAEYFDRTKYAQGLLPIDHYNTNVDELFKRDNFTCDWKKLREDIKEFGLRNSVLTSIMPCESSSLISNSTSGIEPIRDLITIKSSKSGSPIPLVAPEISKLKNKYQKAFSFDNKSMNMVVSVIQKWIDQGISVNHYYNKNIHENGEIPLSSIIKDILDFYKYGGKQLYYANSVDNSKKLDSENFDKTEEVASQVEDGCESGACAI